jgi:D-alanine-D-alanine ligase
VRPRRVTLLYDMVEDEEQPADADTPVYRQVKAALEERGHEVRTLVATSDVTQLLRALTEDPSEIVFNLCESLAGDGAHAPAVASLLELTRKPFTGAGSFGLCLAQDKALAKKLFAFHGLRSPKFTVMQAGEVEWSDDLQFPLFVKPSTTDSSVGIDDGALVHSVKELLQRISFIHTEIKAPALIEEFIEGRELFVSVLGNEPASALPIIEWDLSQVDGARFATASAKWDKSSAAYRAPERVPTDIPEAVCSAMQSAAVEACKALRIFDYGRVDMRVRGSGSDPASWQFYIIEVNPNPYLEMNAEVALAAAKTGLAYAELVERILEAAEKRVLKAS